MTVDEAINQNKSLKVYMMAEDAVNEDNRFMEESYEALDMAIDALRQQKTDKNNEAIWERERRLERYAQEIKAYCESQNGDCESCYFGKPPKEDEVYPAWDCKFNSDNPEDWEVEE